MENSADIRLAPIGYQHMEAIQDLASDPSIGETSSVPTPYPSGGARTWISHAILRRLHGLEYSFAVLVDDRTLENWATKIRKVDSEMEIRVRSAQPQDASFLAWVMLTAGRAHVRRGIWEVVLAEPEEKCMSFFEHLVKTAKPHLFHYSCFLLAEVAGRPASGLGGYDPIALGYAALSMALPEAFSKSGLQQKGELGGRGSPRIVECVPPVLERAWVIESVATLPEFRRKGVVDRLLDEIIETGRKKGFRRAQINIYIGNEPARMAYQKHGFRLLDEKRDSYFESQIGCPGMARLVRDL